MEFFLTVSSVSAVVIMFVSLSLSVCSLLHTCSLMMFGCKLSSPQCPPSTHTHRVLLSGCRTGLSPLKGMPHRLHEAQGEPGTAACPVCLPLIGSSLHPQAASSWKELCVRGWAGVKALEFSGEDDGLWRWALWQAIEGKRHPLPFRVRVDQTAGDREGLGKWSLSMCAGSLYEFADVCWMCVCACICYPHTFALYAAVQRACRDWEDGCNAWWIWGTRGRKSQRGSDFSTDSQNKDFVKFVFECFCTTTYTCIYIFYIYSGYGKYSDPLKCFTLCYIAAIC